MTWLLHWGLYKNVKLTTAVSYTSSTGRKIVSLNNKIRIDLYTTMQNSKCYACAYKIIVPPLCYCHWNDQFSYHRGLSNTVDKPF